MKQNYVNKMFRNINEGKKFGEQTFWERGEILQQTFGRKNYEQNSKKLFEQNLGMKKKENKLWKTRRANIIAINK
jgi:hypothetical protein